MLQQLPNKRSHTRHTYMYYFVSNTIYVFPERNNHPCDRSNSVKFTSGLWISPTNTPYSVVSEHSLAPLYPAIDNAPPPVFSARINTHTHTHTCSHTRTYIIFII